MSSSPLYDFSIVPFTASLKNLLSCLVKAEKYAAEKGEDIESYVELKLIDDMKNFGYQIQRASDSSKSILPRIAGVDSSTISIPDDEKTWADYKSRIERTIAILDAAKPEDFAGKEGIEVSLFDGKFKFTGLSYIQTFALPNFFFHVTTAYALLRMKGVPVGKMDFLAGGGNPAAQ